MTRYELTRYRKLGTRLIDLPWHPPRKGTVKSGEFWQNRIRDKETFCHEYNEIYGGTDCLYSDMVNKK